MDLPVVKNEEEASSSSKANEFEQNQEELECAVCLQTCIHPVKLPCSHIFCFLCVKGVANQSKRCAMCRQEIPADFLEHPTLLKKIDESEQEKEGYQWFYEGRNGWWQYDERTSYDLESAFSRQERLFEILVAGFLYSVDFDRMVQQRRNDPSRRRRIKRDLATIPKKGVAGLKSDSYDDDSEAANNSGRIPPESANNSGRIPPESASNSGRIPPISQNPSTPSQDTTDLSADETRQEALVSRRSSRIARTRRMIRSRPRSNSSEANRPSSERDSEIDREIVNRIRHLTGSLTVLSISADEDDTEEYLLPVDDDAL